jgi:cytochrome oxidase Cu insertion factor (SCO1/SenC/PrrC family)
LTLILAGASLANADDGSQSRKIAEEAGVIMDFNPHPPGSYKLYEIKSAPDGKVLDINGKARSLSEFTGGKVTLLSFIYSSCADPGGCPYAYLVFHNLQSRLQALPALKDKVRLVSVSFDPEYDTPEVLKLYAGDNTHGSQGVQWDFLTTASLRDLAPILDAYGQDVYVGVDPITQKPINAKSHVLKVFLIDRNHVIREIYTASYLGLDVVYNDILTLLMEEGIKLP